MQKESSRRPESEAARPPRRLVFALLVAAAIGLSVLSGCATLAPQQRAILADPTMQFDAEARHEAALHHVIDNREGSMGGTGVSGGGCGCN
jgi:Domain of unknown function (DUF4266)